MHGYEQPCQDGEHPKHGQIARHAPPLVRHETDRQESGFMVTLPPATPLSDRTKQKPATGVAHRPEAWCAVARQAPRAPGSLRGPGAAPKARAVVVCRFGASPTARAWNLQELPPSCLVAIPSEVPAIATPHRSTPIRGAGAAAPRPRVPPELDRAPQRIRPECGATSEAAAATSCSQRRKRST
jgi:hypothetical protein